MQSSIDTQSLLRNVKSARNFKMNNIVKIFFYLLLGLYKTKKPAEFTFNESESYEKGFAGHYRETLLPLAKHYELKRVEALEKSQRNIYLIFIPTILIILLLILMISGPYVLYFIAAVISLGFSLMPILRYQENIKNKIFPNIVSFIEGFNYSPECSRTAREYKDYRILPSYDSESNEDFFSGAYKGVNIELFETTLYREHRNKNGGKSKSCAFKGILISLEVKKSFKGKTIITKDGGAIGNWFAKIGQKRFNKEDTLENVRLEDVEFEKIFEVFSNDQIEARYLLTTSFMERLLKLYNLFGKKGIKASFFKERLLIAIPCAEDMFEPGSILEPEDFVDDSKKLLKEISVIFEIIDTLKLDQDIGM